MKLSQTSFISFLLSTILLFYAMKKIHILILSVITFTCFSCQKQNPKTQLEEIAINFCESFYNFNYPVAEEWSTPSSLSYLSFLASNIQQNHLDQLKTQGAAKASIITSSEITPDSEMATSNLPNKKCIYYQSYQWKSGTVFFSARYTPTNKRRQ